jgi:alkane 1-monooxygenase
MKISNRWILIARHYSGCLLPVSFLLTIYFDFGFLTVIPALLFFVGVPILDPLVGKDRENLESEILDEPLATVLVLAPVLYTVFYIASIVISAWYVSTDAQWLTLAGCIMTMGTVASVGFSASHELIHKKGWWSKFWARAGLLSVAFMHFEIEHLCSHHRHACTEEDTSTGWYGESVYAYLKRSIPKGIVFSWRFENIVYSDWGCPSGIRATG